MKIFHDHFLYAFSDKRHWLNYYGTSHITVIEKLRVRLESKDYLHPSSKKVISLLCEANPLFNRDEDLISRKGEISDTIRALRKHIKSQDYDEALKHIEELKLLFDSLTHPEADSYFKGILYRLINSIGNNEPASREKQNIIYYSKLIAAEFVRIGFRKNKLVGFDGIFDRILSTTTEEDFRKKRPIKFPIPKEISNIQDQDEYEIAVLEFHENRTFQQQFEGIYTIFNEKEVREFMLRIDNVKFSKNKKLWLEYGNVLFTTFKQLEIDLTNWSESEKDLFESVYNQNDSIVAKVKLEFRSIDEGFEQAIFDVKKALGILNFRYGRGGNIHLNRYYAFKGRQARWSYLRSNDLNISVNSKKAPKNNTGIIIPSANLSRKVIDFLTQIDQILFRAYNSFYQDDEIIYYWRYIETLFAPVKFKDYDIINILSKVMADLDVRANMDRIKINMINFISNTEKQIINKKLDGPELNKYLDTIENLTVEGLANFTDYYFLNDMREDFNSLKTNDYIIKAQSYYRKYLHELYEQRNMIIHKGTYCNLTIKSLRELLPRLMKWFRNDFVIYANDAQNELTSPKSLVEAYLNK